MGNLRKNFTAKLEGLTIYGFKGGDAEVNILPRPPEPITEMEIAAFEAAIAVKLPDDHRQFLLEIGGAVFIGVYVRPIETRPDCGDLEVFEILYGGKDDTSYGLWRNRATYEDRLPETMIPIGENTFGDQFCLAIKGRERGKVFFWDHDSAKVYLTAESFEDFLNRLEPDPGT
jgi:hypothetical protein